MFTVCRFYKDRSTDRVSTLSRRFYNEYFVFLLYSLVERVKFQVRQSLSPVFIGKFDTEKTLLLERNRGVFKLTILLSA